MVRPNEIFVVRETYNPENILPVVRDRDGSGSEEKNICENEAYVILSFIRRSSFVSSESSFLMLFVENKANKPKVPKFWFGNSGPVSEALFTGQRFYAIQNNTTADQVSGTVVIRVGAARTEYSSKEFSGGGGVTAFWKHTFVDKVLLQEDTALLGFTT